MNGIKFISNPQSYNPDSVFAVHLSDIRSKVQLLRELNNKLRFPDYFGFNWDALSDCLRDFQWIEQKGIALVHDELPKLDEDTLSMYLQILFGAIQDWKEGEEHYLETIFPLQDKNVIEQHLKIKK